MLFRMGRTPLMVDILPTIAGVDFEAAWRHRVPVVIDPATGLRAWFISKRDLLAAKMAAGRPQDLGQSQVLVRQQARLPSLHAGQQPRESVGWLAKSSSSIDRPQSSLKIGSLRSTSWSF